MPRKTLCASVPFFATHRCFNEAAARCRGKLPPGRMTGRKATLASMRPRPDAAENAGDEAQAPAGSRLQ